MGEYKEVSSGVRMKLVHCSKDIVAIEAILEEGTLVSRHSHESTQMSIVLEGLTLYGSEVLGERVMKPGDYVIAPPGVAHWVRALKTTVVLDVNWPLTQDRRELAEKLGGTCG